MYSSTNKQYSKVCTKCNLEFEATTEFWNKQKNGKFGLNSRCKTCLSIERREYRNSAGYQEKQRERTYRWNKNNPERVKEINRKSRKKNAETINSRRRERYKSDEEFKLKQLESDRKYYKSGKRLAVNSKPENREKARQRSAARRKNAEAREIDLASSAKWREDNRDYVQFLDKKKRDELAPSYIASSMRMKVSQLTPEVIAVKQSIIRLKRELKENNVKIK